MLRFNSSCSRCFSSDFFPAACLVLFYFSALWRRFERGISIHVGNGIGINTDTKKARFFFFFFLCPFYSFLINPHRSHAFYYIFSAFYIAELIASFLASVTVDISPWIPAGTAMASVILCLLILWLVPLPPLTTEAGVPILDTSSDESATSGLEHVKTAGVADALLHALSNTNVLLTIPAFLVGIFRYTTLNVLIQYASIRFNLNISTAAMFYTETALVNIFLFLFMVPRLTAYIRSKYGVQPQRIDLFLVRCSVLLMCCGSLSIGLSWSGMLLPAGKASSPLSTISGVSIF